MYSTRRASDKKLVASVEKGCHGERHLCCVAILLFCHYERSINCHREHSAAICYQGDCHAVLSARLAMTRGEWQVFSRVTMRNNIFKNQSTL